MHQALAQGVAFSCLLVVLGLLRYPVRRSATVRRAAQYLPRLACTRMRPSTPAATS
jgi:hypothetical protein